MKTKLSKKQAEREIQNFFIRIHEKTPGEVKRIKRLAMAHNIKLGEKRKTFCKKCFEPYKFPSIRIKNDMITITCEQCENKSRWKVK